MIRLVVGDLRLTILDAGTLWLDGGAMFGVVPKALWSKLRPPDEGNRICLGMNVLLVEDGRQRILVDTGAGTKWDPKQSAIYRLEPKPPHEILAQAGLRVDDVDVVVNSHLHFDHAGGNTIRGDDGSIRAAFPNATYVFQRGELEFARWDNERIRASYMAENYEPLVAEGRVRLVDGETTFGRHLSLRLGPGHTPHMQVPVVVTRERSVAFLADLVPTASHVPYPYVMGYDVEPLATLASKKRLLPEAHRERWWVVFEHDADLPVARLEERSGRLVAAPAQEVEA